MKLRKLRPIVVMLSQEMCLLPRNIAWMVPGRTVGNSSMNAKVSNALKPNQPSRAFCFGPVE